MTKFIKFFIAMLFLSNHLIFTATHKKSSRSKKPYVTVSSKFKHFGTISFAKGCVFTTFPAEQEHNPTYSPRPTTPTLKAVGCESRHDFDDAVKLSMAAGIMTETIHDLDLLLALPGNFNLSHATVLHETIAKLNELKATADFSAGAGSSAIAPSLCASKSSV